MLLRRRLARGRRADMGTAGTEAWAVLPSGLDVIQQGHSGVQRLSAGREVVNDDATSVFSVNSSRGSFVQPAIDVHNATTSHSSLYTNTSLPPYPNTVRSVSPPAYSELSDALSRRRDSDVVRYSVLSRQGRVYPSLELEKYQPRSGVHI